ncbi:MAG: hypothetical protein R3F15_14160 [Lysobacterales bacterium]
MANAAQIKALIRSHAERDDTRFYAVAMQVAAQAARTGHGKFAVELREAVDQAKARSKAVDLKQPFAPTPLAQPRGELASLLTVAYPKTRLSDMALDDTIQARLDRVLTEQRERSRLLEHGFSPMRKLLLVGPPGTGKTMTAAEDFKKSIFDLIDPRVTTPNPKIVRPRHKHLRSPLNAASLIDPRL